MKKMICITEGFTIDGFSNSNGYVNKKIAIHKNDIIDVGENGYMYFDIDWSQFEEEI